MTSSSLNTGKPNCIVLRVAVTLQVFIPQTFNNNSGAQRSLLSSCSLRGKDDLSVHTRAIEGGHMASCNKSSHIEVARLLCRGITYCISQHDLQYEAYLCLINEHVDLICKRSTIQGAGTNANLRSVKLTSK